MIRFLQKRGHAVYAHQYGMLPGDRLIQPIFQTGISKHSSIYLGIDERGNEWIAENHKSVGVRLIRAEAFFQNKSEVTVERFNGKYNDRIVAVQRALSSLGKPYDIISYNCEHYVSSVQNGKAKVNR